MTLAVLLCWLLASTYGSALDKLKDVRQLRTELHKTVSK